MQNSQYFLNLQTSQYIFNLYIQAIKEGKTLRTSNRRHEKRDAATMTGPQINYNRN